MEATSYCRRFSNSVAMILLFSWWAPIALSSFLGGAQGADIEEIFRNEETLPPIPQDIRVGAYYYPWHADDFHRDAGYIRDLLDPGHQPFLGEYDDRRPEVVGQHLAWSRRANINLWVCSWWGPNTREDVTIRRSIMTHPELGSHKIALLYETTGRIKENEGWEPKRVRDDMAHICTTYFDEEMYYRIEGKPVIVMYLTRVLDKKRLVDGSNALGETVRIMRETAAEVCDTELYIIGDQVWRKPPSGTSNYPSFDYLDAVTNYDVYGNTGSAPYAGTTALNNYSQQQAAWKKVANQNGVAYIPAVSPGYNDRGVRPEKNNTGLSRRLTENDEPGSLLVAQLQRARYLVDSLADQLLLVNSFNEWHEDTQIEPAIGEPTKFPEELTDGISYEGYGLLYLDILRVTTCHSGCDSMIEQQSGLVLPEDPFEGEPPNDLLVGAYYHTWHGDDFRDQFRFLRGELDTHSPQLGKYDDSDPLIIRQHVEWSRRANIGLWIVPFLGADTSPDINLRNNVIPQMGPIRLALQYEAQYRVLEQEGWSLDRVKTDISHICRMYLGREEYYSIQGKPVLFIKLTRKWFRLGLLETILEIARAKAWEYGYELYVVGDQVWKSEPTDEIYLPFFALDAVTNVDVYGNMGAKGYATQEQVDRHYSRLRSWRDAAWLSNCGFVPSVTPGFNNRALGSDNAPLSRKLENENENDGSLFSESLRQARYLVDSNIDNLMIVNSFNNWFEDTQIEPAKGQPTTTPEELTQGLVYSGYGERFLQLLNDATSDIETRSGEEETLPNFNQLQCNIVNGIENMECEEKWSQVFGKDSSFQMEVVVPCGRCIVMDHAGPLLKFGRGLDVQGKLVFPEGYAVRIETPFVRVQGILQMRSTDEVSWNPLVKIMFTDSEPGLEKFQGASSNENVCGTQACSPGSKSFVVAGGKLDIQGVPDAFPSWVTLLDAVATKPAPPIATSLSCLSDRVKVIPPSLTILLPTLGSTVSLREDSIIVTNRRSALHGVRVDLSDKIACLTANDFFVLSFEVRILHPGRELQITNCASEGKDCITVHSDFLGHDKGQVSSNLKYEAPPSRFRYGEWMKIEEWITFDEKEIDENNIFMSLRIGGGEVDGDLEIRQLQLSLAPESACSKTTVDCADLILCNGDAEFGIFPSPFTVRGSSELTVERERETQFWRISREESRSKEDGIQWSIPIQCVQVDAVYRIQVKVRVFDVRPVATAVYMEFEGVDGRTTRQVIVCPPSNNTWISCDGFFRMPELKIGELQNVNAYFVVEGAITATYDLDDLSFTFEQMGGEVSGLIVSDEVRGKWGVGSSILITSSTIDWRDQFVRKIVGLKTQIEAGTVLLELSEPIPRPFTRTQNSFAAEIAILSRNIVLSGGNGVTIWSTPNLQQSIVGLRVTGFGSQEKSLSRHPIYFHQSGDANKSILSKNVVTKSTNGCIVVVGTSNMAVEDNVAFDTAGACFVSKGTRTEGISWRGNLGAKTWRVATEVSSPTSSTFSTRMQSPITFLIAADNCTCEQNVAAGSQGKGFEVVLDHQGAQNFIFNGNMAHSNKVLGVHAHSGNGADEADLLFHTELKDIKVHRNAGKGLVLSNTGYITVTESHFMDNRGSIHIENSDTVSVHNTTIVGYSDELLMIESTAATIKMCPDRSTQLAGIHFAPNTKTPEKNGLDMKNCIFSGFDDIKICKEHIVSIDDAIGLNPTFTFYSSFENIAVEQNAKRLGLCKSKAAGLLDAYLIDRDGSFRPREIESPQSASVVAFGANALSFLEESKKCTKVDSGCYHYCQDVCLRSAKISVDPSILEIPSLVVCIRDEKNQSDICELYEGASNYDHAEGYVEPRFVPRSLDYWVTLPKGRFEAHFVDALDNRVWPKFAEISYSESLCSESLREGSIWIPAPPLMPEKDECHELLTNGDTESTSEPIPDWIAGVIGMTVKENFGISNSEAGLSRALCDNPSENIKNNPSPLFSFGQYLDTRCLVENDIYEISVPFKYFGKKDEELKACSEENKSGCRPEVGILFVSNDGQSWIYELATSNIFVSSLTPEGDGRYGSIRRKLVINTDMAAAASAFFYIKRDLGSIEDGQRFCVDNVSISKQVLMI